MRAGTTGIPVKTRDCVLREWRLEEHRALTGSLWLMPAQLSLGQGNSLGYFGWKFGNRQNLHVQP